MKNMKDYYNLYTTCTCTSDVLLLADVFEKFVNSSLKKSYVRVFLWMHQFYIGMLCLKWQNLSLKLFEAKKLH